MNKFKIGQLVNLYTGGVGIILKITKIYDYINPIFDVYLLKEKKIIACGSNWLKEL
jgi:hypothetical protein